MSRVSRILVDFIVRPAPGLLAGFAVMVGVGLGAAGYSKSWVTLIPFMVAACATSWAAERAELKTLKSVKDLLAELTKAAVPSRNSSEDK